MEVHCPNCHNLHTVDVLFFSRTGILVKCNACQNPFFIDRHSTSGTVTRNVLTKKGTTYLGEPLTFDRLKHTAKLHHQEWGEDDATNTSETLKNYIIPIKIGHRNSIFVNFLTGCVIFSLFLSIIWFGFGTPSKNRNAHADIAKQIKTKLEMSQFENARHLALQYYSKEPQMKSHWLQVINENAILTQHIESGKTHFKQGIIAFKNKNFEKSITVFESALHNFNASGDARLITLAHLNLAMGHRMLHDYESSLNHYRDVLINSKKNGFTKYEGKALQGIGALYLQMNMEDEGLMNLESALILHEEMGDRRGEAMDWLLIGMIHKTSSPEKAEECIRRALTISREIGDPIIYNKANHLLSRGFKL